MGTSWVLIRPGVGGGCEMRVLKLMADYGCFPLWEASPGEVGNVDPRSLPISDQLKERLYNWAESYDAILNMADPASSGFKNKDEEKMFVNDGMIIFRDLSEELEGYAKIIKHF